VNLHNKLQSVRQTIELLRSKNLSYWPLLFFPFFLMFNFKVTLLFFLTRLKISILPLFCQKGSVIYIRPISVVSQYIQLLMQLDIVHVYYNISYSMNKLLWLNYNAWLMIDSLSFVYLSTSATTTTTTNGKLM
jgi:hypothetical protein